MDTMAVQNTDQPSLIAVTGVTGNIGGAAAAALSAEGYPLRLLARDSSLGRVPRLKGAQAAPFIFGYDPQTVEALRGAGTVFMVSAHEGPGRVQEHKGFVDAAQEAGVRHLVYLSFDGASEDADFTLGRDHYATEEYIKKSGLPYTFLRDNFYIEAFIEWGKSGIIAGPAGDGRVSAVSQRDVAAAVTAILRNPVLHSNTTYTLTGPQPLTLGEIARILSRETGTAVTYKNETLEEAYASRRAQYDVPDWELDAWVSTYTAIGSGRLAGVTHDVELITGALPLSFEDVLRISGQGTR